MYTIECSYINSDFLNPWKVSLIEPQCNSYVETFKLPNEDAVYDMINTYAETYGRDCILVSERVYSIGPKLNLVKFRLGGSNE